MRWRRPVVVGTLLVVVASLVVFTLVTNARGPDTDSVPATTASTAVDEQSQVDPAAAASVRRALGFYPGYADAATLESVEQELGFEVGVVVQFGGEKDSEDFVGSVRGEMNGLSDWISARRPLYSLTIPLAFGDATARTQEGIQEIRENLRVTAEGGHDRQYITVAELLVENGLQDAVLRLGHEFDGDWYPWSAQASCGGYVAAFQHVADVMRAVSPDFRIEWTGTMRYFDDWAECAYPGDDNVDIIGLDVYDRGGPMSAFSESRGTWIDPVEVWAQQFRPLLESHAAFAAVHGKPVSYPEWGVVGAADSGAFGGDNPTFIRSMAAWLRSLPTAGPGSLTYHAYFLGGAPEYDYRRLEQSSAAFYEEFGAALD